MNLRFSLKFNPKILITEYSGCSIYLASVVYTQDHWYVFHKEGLSLEYWNEGLNKTKVFLIPYEKSTLKKIKKKIDQAFDPNSINFIKSL